LASTQADYRLAAADLAPHSPTLDVLALVQYQYLVAADLTVASRPHCQ
jgi:hypothetical protein